jgi:hypothetical protein
MVDGIEVKMNYKKHLTWGVEFFKCSKKGNKELQNVDRLFCVI